MFSTAYCEIWEQILSLLLIRKQKIWMVCSDPCGVRFSLFPGELFIKSWNLISDLLSPPIFAQQSLSIWFSVIHCYKPRKGLSSAVFTTKILVTAGLILTTYCVQYPHVVPLLRNRIPYSLLKPPKIHAVKGGERS